jgi:LysM repeat protein
MKVVLFIHKKVVTHKVEKGETINQIAQKYHVTPYDIYKLNRRSVRLKT